MKQILINLILNWWELLFPLIIFIISIMMVIRYLDIAIKDSFIYINGESDEQQSNDNKLLLFILLGGISFLYFVVMIIIKVILYV